MSKPLINIAFVICLAFLFSACASKPVQTSQAQDHQYSCYDNDSGSKRCVEDEPARNRDHHESHSHGADIVGYIIFRVVVEGLVHALVHH